MFKSIIAVWASVFAPEITYVQLEVKCIYATVVIGNEGPAFTLLYYVACPLRGKHLV